MTTNNFDVTIGSFDSVQIAELVEIYILDTLGRYINLNCIGIYRDVGLVFIPNNKESITSRIQKKVRAFKYIGLKIEISSNLE